MANSELSKLKILFIYDYFKNRVSAEGGKGAVYDVDSDDGEALGYLKNGIRVEVLETVDGWSHIRYQGHMGYMKDVDLQFLLTEEVVT